MFFYLTSHSRYCWAKMATPYADLHPPFSPEQLYSQEQFMRPPIQNSLPLPNDLTKSSSESTYSALHKAQERATRKRVLGRTILIGFTILLLLVGMTALLLTYICVLNTCTVSNRTIVSTAPLGRVLTVSQVASHMAPLSVPIVMGLFSHLLAAKWLHSSGLRTTNRPTPMQYASIGHSFANACWNSFCRLGHLLSICSSANLPALFSSLRYAFGLNKNVANKDIRMPRLLRISILILFSLLASMYLATAADAWLHASSAGINILSTKPYTTVEGRNLGRQINSTLCLPANANPPTIFQKTCGQVSGGSAGDGKARMEGLRVVSNSSSLHRVVSTNDQTAILVPQTLPPNATYTARTLGVKSQCSSCVIHWISFRFIEDLLKCDKGMFGSPPEFRRNSFLRTSSGFAAQLFC